MEASPPINHVGHSEPPLINFYENKLCIRFFDTGQNRKVYQFCFYALGKQNKLFQFLLWISAWKLVRIHSHPTNEIQKSGPERKSPFSSKMFPLYHILQMDGILSYCNNAVDIITDSTCIFFTSPLLKFQCKLGFLNCYLQYVRRK